jgi:hypothetical protein
METGDGEEKRCGVVKVMPEGQRGVANNGI